jgi:hypothetical protein
VALVNTNSVAFNVGRVFGAVMVGIFCGLIPLAVGRNRDRVGLGWTGFGLCVVSGFLFGLLGAVPMAGLMSVVILVAGHPSKRAADSEPVFKPKTPAPPPYEL